MKPTSFHSHRTPPTTQQGSALALGLVFLLLATLLAVSALATSVAQERMAATLQEQTRVLLAAESAITRTLAEHRDRLQPGADTDAPLHFTHHIVDLPGATLETRATIRHLATAPAASAGDPVMHHFRITAETVSPATGARVRIHQGVVIPVLTDHDVFHISTH